MRVRLAVLFALLFLSAGAALLGVTYGLVASSLPHSSASAKLTGVQLAKVQLLCKEEHVAATEGKGGPKGAPEPVAVAGSCQKAYALGAAASADGQRAATLDNLLVASLVALALLTVTSAGLGWVMAGRVLGPVRSITEAARRASERHLGERLALRGPDDELKELADTFDDMLDRLDAAFASQRRFVADASHELRTPLTVMRTAIDVTLAKPSRTPEQLEAMAVKIRRSVDQAERLIEALLTLAAGDRASGGRDPVDLATVAEDVLETARTVTDTGHLRVEAALRPAWTEGSALLLERLVANLVDNAVRHNLPDGWIRVRTGTGPDGAYVSVANSGAVIDAADVDALFEPFRRTEQRTGSGDGVGLGLAIVASIAAAHGARIEATSRAEGGLDVTVVVPSGAEPPVRRAVAGPGVDRREPAHVPTDHGA